MQIKAENQTVATVTLQNYFRLYAKLAGMTGTAETEAAEFMATYKLGVVPIPTNKPLARIDQSDLVYATVEGKFKHVVDDIVERHEKGQPVLVGTTSVEKSEYLSTQLAKRGVKHEVLNAKNHAREASIIAQAGRVGAVTVATNMAGRGTDIMLGGNAEHLAVSRMQELGLSPSETPEEYEERWDEVFADVKAAVAEEAANPARAASTSRCRTTCCACSAARSPSGSWRRMRMRTRSRWSRRSSPAPSAPRRGRSRRATPRCARTC